jgi:AraC-like DNA-binding protein
LAQGYGWTVEDVICTSGPQDRPFEERHSAVSVAIVLAGTFQYRSAASAELMAPGSVMLGNVGQCFECGHEHGSGDRCVSFHYLPGYFERVALDAGDRSVNPTFPALRLPAVRHLSSLVARATAALILPVDIAWEEFGIELAARTIHALNGTSRKSNCMAAAALARVTDIVRLIERHPGGELTLGVLSREAGLSPYHFLRTFTRVTGLTPHQYVLRARLREAAIRLADSPAAAPSKVLDIAFDSGFADLSTFNRAFRAEFGVSPRAYRRASWLRQKLIHASINDTKLGFRHQPVMTEPSP